MTGCSNCHTPFKIGLNSLLAIFTFSATVLFRVTHHSKKTVKTNRSLDFVGMPYIVKGRSFKKRNSSSKKIAKRRYDLETRRKHKIPKIDVRCHVSCAISLSPDTDGTLKFSR